MTEQEWLDGNDPDAMLDFMFEQTSRRKVELYTSGCYRLVWHLLPDERFRWKVEMRDRYFDGLATAAELDEAIKAGEGVSHEVVLAAWDTITPQGHVQILLDLFGNPFRSVAFDASWRTPAVIELGQEIYDAYAFDRLALIADTLDQAGCDKAEVLTHLRGPGPHVRGCWALDLVLAKE
jgi:hypothetical protein